MVGTAFENGIEIGHALQGKNALQLVMIIAFLSAERMDDFRTAVEISNLMSGYLV